MSINIWSVLKISLLQSAFTSKHLMIKTILCFISLHIYSGKGRWKCFQKLFWILFLFLVNGAKRSRKVGKADAAGKEICTKRLENCFFFKIKWNEKKQFYAFMEIKFKTFKAIWHFFMLQCFWLAHKTSSSIYRSAFIQASLIFSSIFKV